MGFIPVEKRWEVDGVIMHQMLSSFKGLRDPLWLALFPKGTDFTEQKCIRSQNEQKCIRSQKYTAENGLPNLKNVLLPKTKGLCACLEKLKDSLDAEVHESSECGFFFHPPTKDYRLLFIYPEGMDYKFYIYSLGGQLWRKLDNFPYQPCSLAATLNGALHWMVHPFRINDNDDICSNSIMIFNMDTEEFCSKPHPGEGCFSPGLHRDMCIFEMKGKLALYMLLDGLDVQVWVLEDYEKWIWETRYLVRLHLDVEHNHLDVEHYPFRNMFCDNGKSSSLSFLDIQNDELLFGWDLGGLFRCNLREKTVKQIYGAGIKQRCQESCPFARSKSEFYYSLRFFVGYAKTFVSPSGFG
ncbi:hypothetical protein RHMOL_Rhmol11G0164300 [Rhododendron molle]|uniref:Uncharacterized protein n=1 Tax=Rhododendron molle TaxID=49168 RepID=A0ACC0LUH9_RHOML|nr:hypothetical protein RHMOL_Rhmol11G0164300 [Rhododendron molle]